MSALLLIPFEVWLELLVSLELDFFVFNGFCRFVFRLFQLRSQFERKTRFCLETETRREFQYCNDLHADKHECSRLGQFSYSYESSPSLEFPDRYEAGTFTAYM